MPLGIELGPYVPHFAFSISYVSDHDSALGILGTFQDLNGDQAPCSEAVGNDASLDDPREIIFEYRSLNLVLEGPEAKRRTLISDIAIAGEFTNGWQTFTGEFRAIFNISETHDLFYLLENNSPEAVCDHVSLVTGGGASCEPCDHDQANPNDLCISVRAIDVTAQSRKMTLEEIYSEDDDVIDWETCLSEK